MLQMLSKNFSNKLFHRFELSGLFINPIIHGPPDLTRKQQKFTQVDYDKMLEIALISNGSNCLTVFNYNETSSNYWSTKCIGNIIEKYNVIIASIIMLGIL